MAVYKVIQDIEAEDKLLGPLTLKQFIFAGVAAGFAYAAFFTATKAGNILWALPFLPFIAIPAVLAAPIGRDQPSDVWLAAQIRYYTKPRKRLWDQSGIKNLVTITVPKKIEKVYTNGLDQQEVHSRLQALADTIDSRGWAVKNVAVNMYTPPEYSVGASDRLVDPSSLPQAVPTIDVAASDDIMDAANNPVAQNFDQMVNAATQAQRNAAIEQMQEAIKNANLEEYKAIPPPPELINVPTGTRATPPNNEITESENAPINQNESEYEQMQEAIKNANLEEYKAIPPPPELINSQSDQVAQTPQPNEPWFMNQPHPQQPTDDNTAMFTAQTVSPGSNDDDANDDEESESELAQEQALLEHVKQEKQLAKQGWAHHKTIPTADEIATLEAAKVIDEPAEPTYQKTATGTSPERPETVTRQADPDIVELANTNDLSVASVAQIADRKQHIEQHDDEVIINLH